MNIILVIAGYLIGSIPFAWILTKLVTGKDLRELGSGNVGVLNTALSAARWVGLLVFLLEAAKGAGVVIACRALRVDEISLLLSVLAVVVGTRWSVWLGWRGGRGNTAGITGLLLLSWGTFLALVGVWIAVRLLSRKSFIATRASLIALPVLLGAITRSWPQVIFGLGLSLIYLSTQNTETDDHLILKGTWPSLWAFLTSPRRRDKE